ncbi:hypothetical protein DFH28DRAFT_999362 [Melampsora americana]|nr:hypothetical protein DFH28DRAFT_999362 [Melampsora americana]
MKSLKVSSQLYITRWDLSSCLLSCLIMPIFSLRSSLVFLLEKLLLVDGLHQVMVKIIDRANTTFANKSSFILSYFSFSVKHLHPHFAYSNSFSSYMIMVI